MVIFSTFIDILDYFFGNNYVLIGIFSVLFVIKAVIAFFLITNLFYSKESNKHVKLLFGVVASSLFCDIPWILSPFKPYLDYRILNFFVRFSWITTISIYQILTIFINNLKNPSKHTSSSRVQRILIIIGIIITLPFFYIIITDFNCPSLKCKNIFEFILSKVTSFYTCCLLMPISLIITFYNLKKDNLPRILKKQLYLFCGAIVIPMWISDLIQALSIIIGPTTPWINTNYTFVNITNLLITYGILYSARKMVGLRFMNLREQVSLPATANFVHNTKDILLQLSQVNSETELSRLTQTFFRDSFQIPLSKVLVYIRPSNIPTVPLAELTENIRHTDHHEHLFSLIEQFIYTNKGTLGSEQKILVYDELIFSNFYEQNNNRTQSIKLLETIGAEVLIPIYVKNNIIACIIIERNAKPDNELYSESECDHMLIFASYLGNLLHLLQHRNLEMLIAQEKKLTTELHTQQKELNQYKESIHSFLYDSDVKLIGIIFYKGRHFIFGNQAAKQIIKVPINTQRGHPLSKTLLKVAHHVEEYRIHHTVFAKDVDGRTIVLSGVPHLEENTVIIIVSYPDVADIIKKQMSLLNNPSERDYLLHLESTQAGSIIKQFLPADTPTVIQIKIDILKTSLSDNVVLLNVHEDDIIPILSIIQRISGRDTMYTLDVKAQQTSNNITIDLFGINPLFVNNNQKTSIMVQLAHCGLLFINHIDRLNLETQLHLVELIKYGYYRLFKSDKKESSNVRIVATTSRPLEELMQQNLILPDLYTFLKTNVLAIPPLYKVPATELEQLAESHLELMIKQDSMKHFIQLTEVEKKQLKDGKIASFSKLKQLIELIVLKKTYKYSPDNTHSQEPVRENNTSHSLEHAIRLGKLALKEKPLMELLWKTYKNQYKIATLLGVNRSSVNRRCKMYNLE